MNTFKELATIGFSPLVIEHDVKGLLTHTTAHIRTGTPDGRTFLFIAGYLQPSNCWSGLIQQVWRKNPRDTLIVLSRRGEDARRTPKLTGILPLSWQRAEVRSAVMHLERRGHLVPGTTLVGHSLGALLGRHLVETFPQLFARIVQIAPTPDTRWTLLLSASFWKNGGLLALPSAIKGFFAPWRGVRMKKEPLRTLFAGKRIAADNLSAYEKRQVPDSALLFTELLTTYRGYELIRAHRHGWDGEVVYAVCPGDAVTAAETTMGIAAEHENAGMNVKTITLAYETPHAWFASDFWDQENGARWREIFA